MISLGAESLNRGASSKELKKMIIPSILFHTFFIAFVIALHALSMNRVSLPSVYMVSLVSLRHEIPLGEKDQWFAKEAAKIERIEKTVRTEDIKKIRNAFPLVPLKKGNSKKEKIDKKNSTEKALSKDREAKEEENRRKIYEALSRVKNEISEEKKAKDFSPQQKGGVITSKETDLRFQIYYTIIWGKIKERWILPEGLLKNKEGLEAILTFKILRNGTILDLQVEKPSGDPYFDKSVVRAVEKADSLPPLPEGYTGEYLDVWVRFHPSELQ